MVLTLNMLILNISEREREVIKKGNLSLLKKKLESEKEKWMKNVLLSKDDQRFYQGVCCTLIDVLELL